LYYIANTKGLPKSEIKFQVEFIKETLDLQ
jgi:ATP-binding cassette, subfamily A (ABC1), member 3